MSWGARLFVAFVFTILGLSFIATTVALFNEFQEFQWLSFATIYSHLFLFFPTFGIIALIAFYIPAVAFVDLYWHHIPFGKIRFIFGFLVVSAASYYIGDQISRGEIPAIWQLKPEVLKADQPVLVDFWAEWCVPCKMLTPIVEEVAKDFEGKIKVGKLNVDEAPESSGKFGIQSIPTLMVFKGGEAVKSNIGVVPKDMVVGMFQDLI